MIFKQYFKMLMLKINSKTHIFLDGQKQEEDPFVKIEKHDTKKEDQLRNNLLTGMVVAACRGTTVFLGDLLSFPTDFLGEPMTFFMWDLD